MPNGNKNEVLFKMSPIHICTPCTYIYNTYIYIVIIILILLFRCIDFRGTHTNKAQYIRLAFDTRPELVLSLLLREWCLERPKLLITTTGGKANFELQSRIKRSLRRGLLKAAKTTGEKQTCL